MKSKFENDKFCWLFLMILWNQRIDAEKNNQNSKSHSTYIETLFMYRASSLEHCNNSTF